jgi:DNA-binding transcriptional LysR family regulator
MVAGLVREALRLFREKYSHAAIRISTSRRRARIEGVSNGSLDLAVVTHDEPSIHEIARRAPHVEPLVSYRLALVCASDSSWHQAVRALPKGGVAADELTRFALVLPEPDAGVRKGIDGVLRDHEVLGRLQVALEIGGWGTILAYVRDGLGVGTVSEAAIVEPKGLIIRPLDPRVFDPVEAKLIGRRLGGSGEDWDLSEAGQAWRAILRKLAQTKKL